MCRKSERINEHFTKIKLKTSVVTTNIQVIYFEGDSGSLDQPLQASKKSNRVLQVSSSKIRKSPTRYGDISPKTLSAINIYGSSHLFPSISCMYCCNASSLASISSISVSFDIIRLLLTRCAARLRAMLGVLDNR